MTIAKQAQRVVEMWRALPRRQRDRYAVWGFLGAILALALIVVAVSSLQKDDPTPVGQWRMVAPEVARVTDVLFPSVTLRTDQEACRLLLAWARSRGRSVDLTLARYGVSVGEYNVATYRCAAVGVWPSR